MKNRWSVNLSGFAVEYVDTASFLKKVREYDLLIQGRHRGGLTAAQREELDADGHVRNTVNLMLSAWLGGRTSQ